MPNSESTPKYPEIGIQLTILTRLCQHLGSLNQTGFVINPEFQESHTNLFPHLIRYFSDQWVVNKHLSIEDVTFRFKRDFLAIHDINAISESDQEYITLIEMVLDNDLPKDRISRQRSLRFFWSYIDPDHLEQHRTKLQFAYKKPFFSQNQLPL